MYCETPELVSSVWKLSVVLLMRNQVTTVAFIVEYMNVMAAAPDISCLPLVPQGQDTGAVGPDQTPSFMAGGTAQAAVVTLLSPGKERAVD